PGIPRWPTDSAVSWHLMHLVVRADLAPRRLPAVQHLAAQAQDRLELLVAPHLCRAPGGIALDQEEFVARDVGRFAVRQLARQHRDPRALALLDLLRRAVARLRLAHHQLGQPLAVVDVLVEPELEP